MITDILWSNNPVEIIIIFVLQKIVGTYEIQETMRSLYKVKVVERSSKSRVVNSEPT
jgi:hypothetical protein